MLSCVHCLYSSLALHVCAVVFGCCINTVLFQSSSQCDVSTPGGDTVVPVATNVDNFRQPELSPDFPVSVATTGNVATLIG